MTIRLPSLLALALLLAMPAAAAQESEFTTAAYLDLPELFQVATLSGAMAVLREPAGIARGADRVCFERWPADDDVLAILADYAWSNPHTMHAPFGITLVEALRARCARS